jgi:hypothetical protein
MRIAQISLFFAQNYKKYKYGKLYHIIWWCSEKWQEKMTIMI